MASLFISILSLIIASILPIRTLLQERKGLKVNILSIAKLPFPSKRLHLNTIFINHSKLPISISGVKIITKIDGENLTRYARFLEHRAAHTTKKSKEAEEINKRIDTTPIPFKIDTFGSIYALITFDLLNINTNDFLNDTTYIEFQTSRGTLNQKYYLKEKKTINIIDMLDFPNK
ncbi:hypothetical protein [Staphylococcus equorum]|uniref:hypothetical protein n=1 Tax=Staphylococcus equorum TaxID=246432 RepID=UPI0037D9D4F5